MSVLSENKLYYRARKAADLIDIAFAEDTLDDKQISRISRLLGEIEYTIFGDRRVRK